jgi:Putative beta barrel porin-7 (BBP7)
MTQCLTGSRFRRVAGLGLLCGCAVAAHIGKLSAYEIIASDQASGGDLVAYGHCDATSPSDDCGACIPPGDPHRGAGWFGAEYLGWRLDGNPLPPLVSAGPVTTPPADVAQLDDPDTVILAGDEMVNDDWRSGYRIAGGFWLESSHTFGGGADYFDAGNDDFDFVSPQDPALVVGRPFFNSETGLDDLQLISAPNELDGTVEVDSNDDFQGAGVTFNGSLWRDGDPRWSEISSDISLLGGYRYYTYDTSLSVIERLTVLPGTLTPLVPGTTFLLQDSFRTQNEFHGGEIGLQASKHRGKWWLDGLSKIAIGAQRRAVIIDGQTIIDVPDGGVATAAGGLLTSEITNVGRYQDSDFVVIPEFRLGVGVKLARWLSVHGGYNVIIWSDVARAASHLPPGLAADPRNLPPIQADGGPDPAFPGSRGSQLVAHGFDASVMCQW